MIRNRYNYLTPSIQDTKGKEDALKATAPRSKHHKQKAKRTVSFPNNWPNGYPKWKKKSPDVHTKTYNDRSTCSKPQQKHRLVTVSKTITGGLKIDFTWPQPSPLTLPARETKADTYANSVDPDDTDLNEPSHLDLHCLPFYFRFFSCTTICNSGHVQIQSLKRPL